MNISFVVCTLALSYHGGVMLNLLKMKEFKGTKGGWKLANNEYGYYTSVRNLDDTRKVCVSRVNNLIESNANMVLISHAPEMLEALMECKEWIENCNQYSPIANRLKDLLERATTI